MLSCLVRWVIGKEGSYIKQLEERSKAVVRISDSSSREYGREWKYVQLQGHPRAVDRAKSTYFATPRDCHTVNHVFRSSALTNLLLCLRFAELLHIRLERLIQRLSSKESAAAAEEEVVVGKDENSKDTTNLPEAPAAAETTSG